MQTQRSSKMRILRNNQLFFYTSAFNSGIQNIVTQMFYQDHCPEQKEIFMPLTLLLGSAATVTGIFLSNRRPKLPNPVIFGMVGTIIISFSLLFAVSDPVYYIIFFCLASFLINYLFNTFDRYIAKSISESEKNRNVKILLSYQMAAYIVSPIFFSCCTEHMWIRIAFVVIAGILAYGGIVFEYTRSAGHEKIKPDEKKKTVKKPGDAGILAFCFCMFTAVYMLISSVAYLFRDYMQYSDYAFKSSLFLGLIVLISAVIIAFVPPAKNTRRMILAPAAIIISICILLSKNGNVILMIATALICGTGYGFFLHDGKHYVNFASSDRNMVGRYNTVMTMSTFSAYALSAVIGIICTAFRLDAVLFKFLSAIVFFTAAILLLLLNKENKKEEA